MNPQPFTSGSQSPKTNPYLTPAYLLSLSSHIQTLSAFYQQQNLPSLSPQYKSFLQSTFKNLANSLNLFSQDQTFILSSLISTKVQLQTYLGEKLFNLLQVQTQPLAQIVKFILLGYKQNAEHYEELLIRQKKTKVQLQNEKNEQVINNLKKQVIIKREYVKQLQQRIRDLQEQNSKIYQKIIDNAKNTISSTLIQSKVLTSSSQFMTPGKYSKLITNLPQQSSPVIGMKVSHKQMSLKQVQETILEVLNSKRKKESISMKRISMKSYVKYFFKHKFGLNDLCDEMRTNFLSAVRHFLSSKSQNQTSSTQSLGSNASSPQQKPLLLLFQKLLDQQIDESYFWNQYIPRGLKVIKLFKRYLNEKQKVQLKQLDRLYEGYQGISGSISNYSTNKIIFNEQQRKDFELDENDVRQILCNFYTKSKEIQTLQMIFAEIIGSNPSQQKDNWIGFEQNSIFFSRMKQPTVQQTVLSKQLLAIILCYEIESYSIKLSQLTNIVKRHSSTSEYVTINYTALEKIVLEMRIQEQNYLPYFQQNFNQLKEKQFSYSQIVQIIDALANGDNSKEKYLNSQNYSSRKL